MIDMLQGFMVRIFAGGIICAAALIVTGEGAKKEIVRLCCACLMIIFVLTPIDGADFNLDTLLGDREAVTRQIQGALSTARDSRLEAVSRELTAHIEGLAREEGIEAAVQVACHLEGDTTLVIDSVTVCHQGGGQTALSQLKGRIMADFDLEAGQIIIKEAAG